MKKLAALGQGGGGAKRLLDKPFLANHELILFSIVSGTSLLENLDKHLASSIQLIVPYLATMLE